VLPVLKFASWLFPGMRPARMRYESGAPPVDGASHRNKTVDPTALYE
jgi:hypothetical protein